MRRAQRLAHEAREQQTLLVGGPAARKRSDALPRAAQPGGGLLQSTLPGDGAQLAAVCASCHRLDGRDRGIPSIIGLDEATLVADMRAFKSGERPGQIMRVMSLSLTAEDFAAVARYLAQRKDVNPR